jgi:hypothetical protein
MLRNWAASGRPRPTLSLDFIAMGALGVADSRLTYSGGAGGTYTDSAGTIRPQRTNLLLWSATYDNIYWTKTRSSVVPNAITALDGTNTGYKLVEDTTASNNHYIGKNSGLTLVSGTTYTFSIPVKAAERTFVSMTWFGLAEAECTFNLVTGAVTQKGSAALAATTRDLGDGRWLISATWTYTGTGSGPIMVLSKDGVGTTVYTGDGVSGVYVVGGAQLEPGSSVTAYMPTTTAAVVAPRFDCNNVRTNYIRNNTMVGAVAGTPGTAPTNWPIAGATVDGLTRQIVGTGIEDGIPYIDIKYSGTVSAGAVSFGFFYDQQTSIPASSGQSWTLSHYLRLAGGSFANMTVQSFIRAFAADGATVLESLVGSNIQGSITGAALSTQRFPYTVTLSNASDAFIQSAVRLVTGAAGSAVDFTLRIGMPQLEPGSSATTVIATSGSAASAASAAGLLVEEQRTNSIRNNTMVGAVAGTPGTLPTNWNSATTWDGLARQVVGTGTENGIAYIDIRHSGTVAAGGVATTINYDSSSAQSASSGQTWTHTAYLRLVGGSMANLGGVFVNIRGYDAATVLLENFLSADLKNTITGAPLIGQRLPLSSTLTNVNTAFVMAYLRLLSPAAGTVVDFTLRIGLPQLGLGSPQDSVIFTSSAAVTRTADNVSLTGTNFSPWFNPTQGTIVVEYEHPTNIGAGNYPSVAAFRPVANTSVDTIEMFANGDTGGLNFLVRVGGVDQFTASAAATGGAIVKAALSYAANNFAAVLNGVLVATDASGALPSVDHMNLGLSGGKRINSHLRRVWFYPQPLPVSTLQVLTAP